MNLPQLYSLFALSPAHDSLHNVSPLEIDDPPPKWMSCEAKEVWLRGATSLLVLGVLNPMDKLFFTIFCATYARMQTERRSMLTGGTKKQRAGAEKYVMDFEGHLSDMLLQMGFSSESDFERFLHQAVQ